MAFPSSLSKVLAYFSGENGQATSPILFSSPHSGRLYTEDFLSKVVLPLHILQSMEDRFVDSFLSDVPNFGDSVICAKFPRSICDVNRDWRELDRDMFLPILPREGLFITQKVRAGYGVIPRCAAPGRDIYRYALPQEEVHKRIFAYWKPYHNILSYLLSEKHRHNRYAVLFDVHSMPKIKQRRACHIVLGDCHGGSCSRFLIEKLKEVFTRYGYLVQYNTPYAGGYITQKYGNPTKNYHAVQIELCRSLYLNMNNLEPNAHFNQFKEDIYHIFKEVSLWIKQTNALL